LLPFLLLFLFICFFVAFPLSIERSVEIGKKRKKRKKSRKERNAVRVRKELVLQLTFGSRCSYITAVLLPFSPSLLFFPLLSSPLLSASLGFVAETERSAAATTAAETSTLVGYRSCGTGLRELPLEELHSPYVLPRLHVTHIYTCAFCTVSSYAPTHIHGSTR